MVVGPGWRVCSAQPRPAAPIEGRLDGDGGVTRTVETQRLSVARLSRVTGDDPGQVVCNTTKHTDVGKKVVVEGVLQRLNYTHFRSEINSLKKKEMGVARWGNLMKDATEPTFLELGPIV